MCLCCVCLVKKSCEKREGQGVRAACCIVHMGADVKLDTNSHGQAPTFSGDNCNNVVTAFH